MSSSSSRAASSACASPCCWNAVRSALVALRLLAAELLHRGARLVLESWLAAVDVVEAPRELARDFDMRNLVLADRHLVRAIDEDVGAHHHRIAEEAEIRQIAVGELLLLILVRRHPLEPADGRDHAEQQRQLGVLGHARLDEQRRARRIDAGREPVDEHVPDAFGDRFGLVEMRRERMPVGGEEQALVFFLQPDPVLQRTVIDDRCACARWAACPTTPYRQTWKRWLLLAPVYYSPTNACSDHSPNLSSGPMTLSSTPNASKPDDDEQSERLDAGKRVRRVHGKQADGDAAAVERRYGQKVKCHQYQIDRNADCRHLQQMRVRESAVRRDYLEQQRPQHRHQEIRARSGRCHPEHVALRVAQVAEIDRHRLRPAEHELRTAELGSEDQQPRDQDRSDRVDMLQRVQRDPALHLSRAVAERLGDIAVGRFVQRDREDHRQHPQRDSLQRYIHLGRQFTSTACPDRQRQAPDAPDRQAPRRTIDRRGRRRDR